MTLYAERFGFVLTLKKNFAWSSLYDRKLTKNFEGILAAIILPTFNEHVIWDLLVVESAITKSTFEKFIDKSSK